MLDITTLAAVAATLNQVLAIVGPAAGPALSTLATKRYQEFMLGKREARDLQEAFALAYVHALQDIFRAYREDHVRLPPVEREWFVQAEKELKSDLITLRNHLPSSADLAVAVAKTPRGTELRTRLLTLAQQKHLRGASPELIQRVERDFYDSLCRFLWEALKINPQAQLEFQNNVLTASYEEMHLLLSTMAQVLPGVQQHLKAVTPQAEQLVGFTASTGNLPAPLPAAKPARDSRATPVAKLIANLRSGNVTQRVQAVRELMVLQSDEAVEQLRALLQDQDEEMRLYALFILVVVRPAAAVPDLVHCVTNYHQDPEILGYARQQLESLKSPEAIQALADYLIEPHDGRKPKLTPEEIERELQFASAVLVKLAEPAIEPVNTVVRQCIKAHRPQAARYPVFVLVQLAPQQAIEGLAFLARNDPVKDMRDHAQGLLDNIRAR